MIHVRNCQKLSETEKTVLSPLYCTCFVLALLEIHLTVFTDLSAGTGAQIT